MGILNRLASLRGCFLFYSCFARLKLSAYLEVFMDKRRFSDKIDPLLQQQTEEAILTMDKDPDVRYVEWAGQRMVEEAI